VTRQQTILIVEDETLLSEVWCELFNLEGFQAISAENGLRALELLETTTPDFILTDVRMPKMGGIEFFKELRKKRINIPVMFMTGFTDSTEINSFIFDENFWGYFKKPVSVDSVLQEIRKRQARFPDCSISGI
jgi:CheY-like chemotaxis protein